MTTRRKFNAVLGGAAAWPRAARAQQSRGPMIGFLGAGSPEPNARNVAAFRQGLAEAGYIDGQNVTIEFRWANYQNRLVPGLAADLIRRQPAVLVATGAISPALAAKAATSTIPIVFASGGDPVKYGLVASLNRPGGNITGVTISEELAGKRVGLLRELVLKARAVAYLSPDSRILTFEQQRSDIVAAARALGLQIIAVEANSDHDFEPAFATFVQRGADALVVGIAPFLFGVPSNRDKILELAARHKIPAMYPNRSDAVSGGLMSYSSDVQGSYRLLGVHYVGQILRGAKPADLPV